MFDTLSYINGCSKKKKSYINGKLDLYILLKNYNFFENYNIKH